MHLEGLNIHRTIFINLITVTQYCEINEHLLLNEALEFAHCRAQQVICNAEGEEVNLNHL